MANVSLENVSLYQHTCRVEYIFLRMYSSSRGGSRISEKGVHILIIKAWGSRC